MNDCNICKPSLPLGPNGQNEAILHQIFTIELAFCLGDHLSPSPKLIKRSQASYDLHESRVQAHSHDGMTLAAAGKPSKRSHSSWFLYNRSAGRSVSRSAGSWAEIGGRAWPTASHIHAHEDVGMPPGASGCVLPIWTDERIFPGCARMRQTEADPGGTGAFGRIRASGLIAGSCGDDCQAILPPVSLAIPGARSTERRSCRSACAASRPREASRSSSKPERIAHECVVRRGRPPRRAGRSSRRRSC